MKNKNDSFALMTGLLIGAAAGAAAGILLAPCSGEKTIEKIKNTRKNFRHRLKQQLESFSKMCCSTEDQSGAEANTLVAETAPKPTPTKSKAGGNKQSNQGKGHR